jgi:hypothetical protein
MPLPSGLKDKNSTIQLLSAVRFNSLLVKTFKLKHHFQQFKPTIAPLFFKTQKQQLIDF